VVKTNAFFGKFIDQTFHVVERVSSYAPWKFIDVPLGRRALDFFTKTFWSFLL